MIFGAEDNDPVRLRTLKVGANLFQQGDSGKAVFVVVKGELLVSRREKKTGKKIVLAKIKERQIVGEMAFFDDGPRSASVEALKDSEVLELNTKHFESYLRKQPLWLRLFIESLVAKIRATNLKVNT